VQYCLKELTPFEHSVITVKLLSKFHSSKSKEREERERERLVGQNKMKSSLDPRQFDDT
jgi:hypothetical protein